MKGLTLKQPWAHLVVHGGPDGQKDIENRGWPIPRTFLNTWIAIHAGKSYEKGFSNIPKEELDFGAIIGFVKFSDCVQNHPSKWAIAGQYHWVISEVYPLEAPIPCKGALGFWNVPESLLLNVPTECDRELILSITE